MLYFKEMVGTLFRGKGGQIHDLTTDFKYTGLKEYPRPQMVRESYINLNGQWNFRITDKKGQYVKNGKIEVPFSPEARLSGTGADHILQPDEILVYDRTIIIDEIPKKKRLILHFGAVDQVAEVFVNDKKVGSHKGGYTAFEFDITDCLQIGENKLRVEVKDFTDKYYYGRGKQCLKTNGMWYTAQSGIWQTVWMEWVPEEYIKSVYVKTDIDTGKIFIELEVSRYSEVVDIEFNQKNLLKSMKFRPITNTKLEIEAELEGYECWSCDNPILYGYTITYGEDVINCYLAMRLFSCEKDKAGKWRLCLNHQPTFFNGILDQGYYPESLMTPPSDEAMVFDIKTMKSLGFNMLRKHAKIEPMRWYYHCDKLGMVVWQDMVNGGTTYDMTMICYLPTIMRPWTSTRDDGPALHKFSGRVGEKSHQVFRDECEDTIRLLKNVPCIGEWTIFNEGWGQFDAVECTKFLKTLDNTRPIDSSSGWFHQDCGDIFSEHKYFEKIDVKRGLSKPYVLSEYGGYGMKVDGHVFCDAIYGYKNYSGKESFKVAYKELMDIITALVPEGLSAAVYTQLSDIEEEQNGLLTYDRKVKKL